MKCCHIACEKSLLIVAVVVTSDLTKIKTNKFRRNKVQLLTHFYINNYTNTYLLAIIASRAACRAAALSEFILN